TNGRSALSTMSSPKKTPLHQTPAFLPPAVAEGTRRRILQVALQLFASEGFHGTSIRDIAKAVELQPSAIYAHFSSREHVLAALVLAGYEVLLDALTTAAAQAGADPVEKLGALVRAHTTLHATYPHLAVVVNDEIRSLPPDLAAPALALRAQASALLLDVL